MLHKTASLLVVALPLALAACSGESKDAYAEPTVPVQTASMQALEVGCASCIYEMAGVEGCQPAVKIEGETLLVVGNLGFDAHGSGICGEVKQADLTGEVREGEFVASAITLLP